MPMTFVVDQAKSFSGLVFLSCSPKLEFGTKNPDKNSDGVPKWEVQVAVQYVDNFGVTQNEILKVGVAAPKNPAEGFPAYGAVELDNFEVGVMDKVNRKTGAVEGAQVWYRASAIRPKKGA